MVYGSQPYQRKVCEWMSELGLVWEAEYPVGPYHIDVYLPDLFCALEIDGPHHAFRHRQDAQRDADLRAQGIETLRIMSETPKDEVLRLVGQVLGAFEWR